MDLNERLKEAVQNVLDLKKEKKNYNKEMNKNIKDGEGVIKSILLEMNQ